MVPCITEATTKPRIIKLFGYGDGNVGLQRFLCFVEQSEHVDAWREFREHSPSLGLDEITKSMRRQMLKALQNQDPEYCMQQTRSHKEASWVRGDHDVRYVVRIVQWYRPPRGPLPSQRFYEETCGQVIALLRYLKIQMYRNDSHSLQSDLLSAMEDALQERRLGLGGGDRGQFFDSTRAFHPPNGGLLDCSIPSNDYISLPVLEPLVITAYAPPYTHHNLLFNCLVPLNVQENLSRTGTWIMDNLASPQSRSALLPPGRPLAPSDDISRYPRHKFAELSIIADGHYLPSFHAGFCRCAQSDTPNDQPLIYTPYAQSYDLPNPSRDLEMQEAGPEQEIYNIPPLEPETENRITTLPHIQRTPHFVQFPKR